MAYNIQLAVDTDFKLICGVNPVQNPTDHYQIPIILDQIINILGKFQVLLVLIISMER